MLPPRHILSKSTFLRGCQCSKRLWLYKKQPDLTAELTAGQQMVFEKGTDVGLLARQLFPGGKDPSPIDHFHYPEAIQYTGELVQAGETIIYEAAFQYDKVMAALDILVNNKGNWFAYEVKSSTEIKDYAAPLILVLAFGASLGWLVFLEFGRLIVGDSAGIWLFRLAGLAGGTLLALPVARHICGWYESSGAANKCCPSTSGGCCSR